MVDVDVDVKEGEDDDEDEDEDEVVAMIGTMIDCRVVGM